MFHSPSVGVAQAQKKTSHLDTTLLLPPLPRCRQRFAFAYQPPAIFRSCSPPRQSTLFQDSTTFFHVSQSFSRGCPSAKNEPLGHNSSSAATSSVQARLRVRLPAASYFPFQPLRAEPNGFRVHLLSCSDTVSSACMHTPCNLAYRFFFAC